MPPNSMRPSSWGHTIQNLHCRPLLTSPPQQWLRHTTVARRWLRILAIETSCDDTSVAVLRLERVRTGEQIRCTLEHQTCLTSDNGKYGGIHPLKAVESHQANLAAMVQHAAIDVPDLIAVTRGPGMRGSLGCGIDFAKGLSVAWNRPLIGVHHMQAHALSSRLSNAAAFGYTKPDSLVQHPYLTLLVSGGHTLLVESRTEVEYRILASTNDIAIGDCLDKAARSLLPSDHSAGSKCGVAYGKLLEKFAFPKGPAEFESDGLELNDTKMKYGWSISPPALPRGARDSEFNFSSLPSQVSRIVNYGSTHQTPRDKPMSQLEARDLAKAVMTTAFEHVADRVFRAIDKRDGSSGVPLTISMGGGVAANRYLKYVLYRYLTERHVSFRLLSTAPQFCTDNAAMIAWTAAEMVGAFKSRFDGRVPRRFLDSSKYLKIRALKEWSLENLLTPEVEEQREEEERRAKDARTARTPQPLGAEESPKNEVSEETITEKTKATELDGLFEGAPVEFLLEKSDFQKKTPIDTVESIHTLSEPDFPQSGSGLDVEVNFKEVCPQAPSAPASGRSIPSSALELEEVLRNLRKRESTLQQSSPDSDSGSSSEVLSREGSRKDQQQRPSPRLGRVVSWKPAGGQLPDEGAKPLADDKGMFRKLTG